MKIALVITFLICSSENTFSFPEASSVPGRKKLFLNIPAIKNVPSPAHRTNHPALGNAFGSRRASESVIKFPSRTPTAVTVQVPKAKVPEPVKSIGGSECSFQSGRVIYNGECQHLLSDLPCGEGKWLVINLNGIPECVNKRCPNGELFYKNRCVNIVSNNVCGLSEILYLKFTGESYCDCEPNFVFDLDSSQCHAEQSRGSCPFGKYLEVNEANKVTCVVNPCKRDDLVFNPSNKKCYTRTFVGKCSSEKGMLLHIEKDGSVSCTSISNRNIFEVPTVNRCPPGSKEDQLGDCQVVFRFDLEDPTLFVIPTQQTSSFTSCPSGHSRHPNGTCRRINPLLS